MSLQAPVSGFARSFVTGSPISNAVITVLEDPSIRLVTDKHGRFGPFDWPVGAEITLRLEKKGSWFTGYYTTQTATLVVPKEGFNDKDYLKNISFQVPSNMAFSFFAAAMRVKVNPSSCQIATTVTPPGMTLDHAPQGEPGVDVSLTPDTGVEPYYVAIFKLIKKTNFFKREPQTSEDGGALFVNIPRGIYFLTARKGPHVSTIKIIANEPGVLINASPPHCPVIPQCS